MTVNKVQCINLRERMVSLKTGPADGLIYFRCHFCLAQIGETKSYVNKPRWTVNQHGHSNTLKTKYFGCKT